MTPTPESVGSPYLTSEEAAAYLRFSGVNALYKAMKSGRIPVRRRGHSLLFHKGDLDRWLAGEEAAHLRKEARSKSMALVHGGSVARARR